MKFFEELKRRNVIRVAGLYAVVGWLLAQAAVLLEGSLALPAWFDAVVVCLLLIGFPIALILAWAFELTPEGVKLTANVTEGESIAPRTGRKLDYTIIAGLALVVVVVIADRLAPASFDASGARSASAAAAHREGAAESSSLQAGEERSEAARLEGRGGAASQKSVAVLPFVSLSSGEDDGYFADGLTEEIINALTTLPDLLVTARTSAFHFKGKDEPVPEIAA